MVPETSTESVEETLPAARRSARPAAFAETPMPSYEELQALVARGRRLQAAALADALYRRWVAVRALFTAPLHRPLAPHPASRLADEGFEHDLRTPLTAIRCSSEVLRDNPDMPFEHRQRFLDAIVGESERLEGSINGLLDRLHGKRPEAA